MFQNILLIHVWFSSGLCFFFSTLLDYSKDNLSFTCCVVIIVLEKTGRRCTFSLPEATIGIVYALYYMTKRQCMCINDKMHSFNARVNIVSNITMTCMYWLVSDTIGAQMPAFVSQKRAEEGPK